MKISKEELERVVLLSRLKLDDSDFAKFNQSINDILVYIGQLQEISISENIDYDPPVDFEQVLRPDKPFDFVLDDWTKNVPRMHEDYIEVDAMFNDEQR